LFDLQDHKVTPKPENNLTPFFSAPHTVTSGYLARAVVNNVLQGGLLTRGAGSGANVNGSSDAGEDDVVTEDFCKVA